MSDRFDKTPANQPTRPQDHQDHQDHQDVNTVHQAEERQDGRADDWAAWLRLSSTPDAHPGPNPLHRLQVSAGIVTRPQQWPTGPGARIYVAHDSRGAVYVGQTRQPLLDRVRQHFGNQRTQQQQLKAGSWEFVVTARFDDLTTSDLDRYERAAAEWLLPHCHRKGHRYPRTP